MTSKKSPQTMKATTAAKKLGVYLPATPQEFQDSEITREEFNVLQSSPPEWLVELRTNGPHPRPVVASRLGVSIAGLARGKHMDPLTTEEINAIREENSQWLRTERQIAAEVLAEEEYVKSVREAEAKKAALKDSPRH